MNKLSLVLFAFAILSFAVFAPKAQMPVFAASCDSGSDLSQVQAIDAVATGTLGINKNVDLTGNQVTITVTNNTGCGVPVSLASYKMFGPFSIDTQSQQELFDHTATMDIAASSTQTLSVTIPSCEAQYDLWYGDALTVIPNTTNLPLLAGDQVRIDQPCAQASTTGTALIHIIKHVVNDGSGTSTAANFNIHVMATGTNTASTSADISGSPAPGAESPGTSYTVPFGTYTVSEDSTSGYDLSFSGDCNSSGNLSITDGTEKTCTLTNNDTGSAATTSTSTNPTASSTPTSSSTPIINSGGGSSTSVSSGGGCSSGQWNFALGMCSGGTAVSTLPGAPLAGGPIAAAPTITPLPGVTTVNFPNAGFGPDEDGPDPLMEAAVYIGLMAIVLSFTSIYVKTNRKKSHTHS